MHAEKDPGVAYVMVGAEQTFVRTSHQLKHRATQMSTVCKMRLCPL